MKTNWLQNSLRLFNRNHTVVYWGVLVRRAIDVVSRTGPGLSRSAGPRPSLSSGLGNVVIGGDAFTAYPEGLVATNIYWTPLAQPFYGIYIAPGAVASGGQIIVYGGNDGTSSMSTVINYSPSDGSSPLGFHERAAFLPRLRCRPQRQRLRHWRPGRQRPAAFVRRGLQSGLRHLGRHRQSPDGPLQFSGGVQRHELHLHFWRTHRYRVRDRNRHRRSVTPSTPTPGPRWRPCPWPLPAARRRWGPTAKSMSSAALPAASRPMWFKFIIPPPIPGSISTPLPEGLSASAMGVDSLGRLIVMGGMDTNGNDVGDVWRSQQLGTPDSPPVLTQLPGTNAIYQGAYTSTIAATGNPPAGLCARQRPHRHDGGLFQRHNYLDTAGAQSDRGHSGDHCGHQLRRFHQLVFHHQRPQPAADDADQFISRRATEYSVTLAWTPEDPVAGSVTYSVFIPHPYHSPRGSGGGVNYQLIGSTTSTNITISGLAPNTSYAFDVNATGPGGTSGYAGIGVTTTGPQPPSNLRITGITSTSISLAWDPSPGPVPIARYEILGWIGGLFPTISYGTNFTGTTATHHRPQTRHL